jgi:uncharacterized membrane protein YraQ (UPF0718 family)
MWVNTVVLVAITSVLFIVAVWKAQGLPVEALRNSWKTFTTAFPLIVCAFLCEGLITSLLSPEWIRKWLAEEAGWRSIVVGCIAGALTPGGPYTSFPIAMVLLKAGASVTTVVTYLTAWQLWAFTRYPLEIAFVGAPLTVLRFTTTVFVPPLAGLLAGRLSRFFL